MPMHLNLGCGDKLIDEPGWLNVDSRKLRPEGAAFKRLDIRNIRDYIKDGSAQTVRLWDVIEHFRKPEAEKLLADCVQLLAPGGRLQIKTPCIRLLKRWAQTHDEASTALRWYGGQDYPQNVHLYVWPTDALIDLLERLGVEVGGVQEIENTNVIIEAVKHGGTDHP